ncbi:ATP-binding protein [Microbacterium sp. JZ31]|uniref:ATP-binding protein n=1 Tax=Microbacterium sp. JZ31 TaxID=1906274 RepID=UPI001932357F|nr:ATP-binding protein [Microbacterium sp. JZ31]
MGGEGKTYSLAGFAVPGELDHVHQLLERVGADHDGLDPMDLMLFETAVIEIANNVVEHGRPAGEVRWQFEVRVTDDAIVAELVDSGHEFEPHLQGEMPSEDAEGGRGLLLAQAALDELEWSRTPAGNRWRMVRNLGHLTEA